MAKNHINQSKTKLTRQKAQIVIAFLFLTLTIAAFVWMCGHQGAITYEYNLRTADALLWASCVLLMAAILCVIVAFHSLNKGIRRIAAEVAITERAAKMFAQKKPLEPEKVKELLAEYITMHLGTTKLLNKCLGQLDRISKMREALKRLTELNQAEKFQQGGVESIQSTEQNVLRIHLRIINDGIVATADEDHRKFEELIAEVIAQCEEELATCLEMLRKIADIISKEGIQASTTHDVETFMVVLNSLDPDKNQSGFTTN